MSLKLEIMDLNESIGRDLANPKRSTMDLLPGSSLPRNRSTPNQQLDIARVLEIAKECKICNNDLPPQISRTLEDEFERVWQKIRAKPKEHLMTNQEFAVFNFYRDKVKSSKEAQDAIARFWNYFKVDGVRDASHTTPMPKIGRVRSLERTKHAHDKDQSFDSGIGLERALERSSKDAPEATVNVDTEYESASWSQDFWERSRPPDFDASYSSDHSTLSSAEDELSQFVDQVPEIVNDIHQSTATASQTIDEPPLFLNVPWPLIDEVPQMIDGPF